jgi:hypothetical protein
MMKELTRKELILLFKINRRLVRWGKFESDEEASLEKMLSRELLIAHDAKGLMLIRKEMKRTNCFIQGFKKKQVSLEATKYFFKMSRFADSD